MMSNHLLLINSCLQLFCTLFQRNHSHCIYTVNTLSQIGFVFNLSANSFGDIGHSSSWFSKSDSTEEQIIFAKANVRSLFRSQVPLSVDTAQRHGLVSAEYTITNLP